MDTEALGTLDDAIVTMLGEVDLDAEQTATHLDALLAGSLFVTAIRKQSALASENVMRYLQARTSTLLERYSPEQRRAAYLSGVNIRHGDAFAQLLERYRDAVIRIEGAFARSDSQVEAQTAALLEISAALVEIPTFRPAKLPSEWQTLLRGWLDGVQFANLLESDDENMRLFKELVQDKLQWGIEAIRSNLERPRSIASIGFYFSFGLPRLSAIRFARAGIDSRPLAAKLGRLMDLDESYAGEDVLEWLRNAALRLEEVLNPREMLLVREVADKTISFGSLFSNPEMLVMEPPFAAKTESLAVLVFPEPSLSSWEVTSYEFEVIGRCFAAPLPRDVGIISGTLHGLGIVPDPM